MQVNITIIFPWSLKNALLISFYLFIYLFYIKCCNIGESGFMGILDPKVMSSNRLWVRLRHVNTSGAQSPIQWWVGLQTCVLSRRSSHSVIVETPTMSHWCTCFADSLRLLIQDYSSCIIQYLYANQYKVNT